MFITIITHTIAVLIVMGVSLYVGYLIALKIKGEEYLAEFTAAAEEVQKIVEVHAEASVLHSTHAALVIEALERHLVETKTTLSAESRAVLDAVRGYYEEKTIH